LIALFIVLAFERKSMFAVLLSNINSLISGLLHLTSQPNSLKGNSGKVKYGIFSETKFLGTILVDRYTASEIGRVNDALLAGIVDPGTCIIKLITAVINRFP
jgi:hypothetical protein